MSWADKQLDYLDLTHTPARKITTQDNKQHLCFHITKTQAHLLHSESPQLSTITNLVIGTRVSSKKKQQEVLKILEKLLENRNKQNQVFNEISQNIECLKNSQKKSQQTI